MQGLHRRRPAIGQKRKVFAGGCEFEGAPHLQHKITGEIFPEIAILIRRVVGRIKGDLIGSPQVVRRGPRHLAIGFHPATPLGEIPTDRPLGGIRRRDRSGEAAQHRLIEFRPELQQSKRAIEPHIQAFVPGIVETLEHAEAAVGILTRRSGPQASATSQVVKLVE